MMSERLEWTERLGSAFLQDQGRVMDTVQALRRRADAAGNLKSNAEQSVVHEKETIIIEPALTEVVYVPLYDSAARSDVKHLRNSQLGEADNSVSGDTARICREKSAALSAARARALTWARR